jgi:hypothetical protein
MNRKIVFIIFILVLVTIVSHAQPYKNAIGFRISGNSSVGGAGVSYKHFLKDNKAIEGIFSFKDPVGIAALYQVHKDLSLLENLTWFYGGGAYISFSKPDVGFGLLGNVGVDYRFDAIPLNLSIDWKPEFALAPKAGLNFNTFGFTLRVILDKKNQ